MYYLLLKSAFVSWLSLKSNIRKLINNLGNILAILTNKYFTLLNFQWQCSGYKSVMNRNDICTNILNHFTLLLEFVVCLICQLVLVLYEHGLIAIVDVGFSGQTVNSWLLNYWLLLLYISHRYWFLQIMTQNSTKLANCKFVLIIMWLKCY